MKAIALLLPLVPLGLSWLVPHSALAQGAPPTASAALPPQPASPPTMTQPQSTATPFVAPPQAAATPYVTQPQPAGTPNLAQPAATPAAPAPAAAPVAPQPAAVPAYGPAAGAYAGGAAPPQYVLQPIAPVAGVPPSNANVAPPTSNPPKRDRDEDEDEDPPHSGFFSRFTVGLGTSHLGNGDLLPKPGFKPIYRLEHTSPVISFAGQVGGGFHNFALAGELLYEQMLERVEKPSTVGFHIVAVGLAGSYYLDYDFFLTGHLRWVGLIIHRPDCLCFWDRLDSTAGPGLGLTLGKEWFWRRHADEEHRGTRRHSSIGVALQGNYARFAFAPRLEYLSGLVLLTLSHF